MVEMITIPCDELDQLKERARKLAMEKSYLQLVNNLITNLSSVAGLEETAEKIVQLIVNNLGGTNVTLYYRIDSEIFSVDVYGKKGSLSQPDDDLVIRVFDSREFIEIRHDFTETKMLTPEFTKSSDWAFPLTVGERLMGALKMEGMLLSAAEVRDQLKPFFSYSALVLKNEIENYSRLKETFDQVQQMNEQLTEKAEDLRKKGKELEDSRRALIRIVDDLNLKTDELEKANAKLRELDTLKSMFIASMSHELRTPLNSIIGFSSILVNEWLGPLSSEQKENLAIILRSGKHLLSLINDVIDVSKVEAGIIEKNFDDFDIYDLIAEAATTFAKDISGRHLELKIESVHQQMHTDRRRLLQCVLNLISNAVKFTEEGSITVQAVITETANPDAWEEIMEISVTDTGIGIDEENLPKLFNAFVRLDSPLKAKIPGTGLGLYLTKKLLIEILKGEIICQSSEGKGSRFLIKVPLRIE
ncbi:MAG: hypothetical protein HGA78_07855 [Nitrospirales bacterium]|nr:hypothetical protein [Nitrospirales bacterium]